MRLLIDATTTQDEKKNNGIGQYTKNLLLEILSKDTRTEFCLLLFDAPSTLDDFLSNKAYENVNVVRIGKLRSNNYLNPVWFHMQFMQTIKSYAKKGYIYFCPYFWRGLPSRKIPTVLTVYDFAHVKYKRYSMKTTFPFNQIRKFQYWHELNKLTSCKKLISISQNTTKDIEIYYPKYPKEQIVTIPLGCSLEKSEGHKWKEMLPSDWRTRSYLIYMGGGVTPNKNSTGVVNGYYNFLSKAAKVLKLNYDKLPYLVIAGKEFVNDRYEEVVNLRRHIRSLGLESNIIFTGFYSDTDAFPLLKNAFCFTHLSLYEGFGIAVCEAMAAGVPVVAHNGSSYPEVVGDGGLLVDGLDQDAVGSAYLKIYTDRDYASKLSEKGLLQSRRFKWENTASETFKILNSVWQLYGR